MDLYFAQFSQNPGVIAGRVRRGVQPFLDFLNRAREHALRRPPCLGWQPVESEPQDREDEAVWVELVPPEDGVDPSEPVFDAFLEDTCRQVFEFDANELTSGNTEAIFRDDTRRIDVRKRRSEDSSLLLAREPTRALLALKPNTHTIDSQTRALRHLRDAPAPAHAPLVRLFEGRDRATWPSLQRADEPKWLGLTLDDLEGTAEQRDFVRRALGTPDFAILEGPPGSGKTSAICELILQLATSGKRVLLCASTHVAVDNVLERIMDRRNEANRGRVLPVRIGDPERCSQESRPYQLEHLAATELARIRRTLAGVTSRTAAQEQMLQAMDGDVTTVERLVLDAANLVCGTMIGILQHPTIKRDKRSGEPAFDVLIVDEASKTTIGEFFVPALLARRWILVGDPKQLSPYVDDHAVATTLDAALDPALAQVCLDVFLANRDRGSTLVVASTSELRAAYLAQAQARGVSTADLGDPAERRAGIVFASSPEEAASRTDLRGMFARVRGPAELHSLRSDADRRPPGTWGQEIGWRIARHFEQRLTIAAETATRLRRDIDDLLPVDVLPGAAVARRHEEHVRRVALPSILEALQLGVGSAQNQDPTVLTAGFKSEDLVPRHVRLSFQHRMHPDIAALSFEHVYQKAALHSSRRAREERAWTCPQWPGGRNVWIQVGSGESSMRASRAEARVVADEVTAFIEWAQQQRHPNNRASWEVAVLTFYRAQEREVRETLRAARRRRSDDGLTPVKVQVCTVDRFQGHEADVVFLTFARSWPTNFLESANRLNVALTRARFQRVIVGDRTGLGATRSPVLAALTHDERTQLSLREVRRG